MLLRVPIVNLAGAPNLERSGVEARNPADPAFLRENAIPETIDAFANASDRTESGDDRAPSAHAATLFALASTYAFIQRKVLLATLRIKKSPID